MNDRRASVVVLLLGKIDAKNWFSSLDVVNKAIAANGENASLLRFKYYELSNLRRWGRLNPAELTELDQTKTKLENQCNPTEQQDFMYNNLCLNYWIQGLENDPHLKSDMAQNYVKTLLPSHQDQHLARVTFRWNLRQGKVDSESARHYLTYATGTPPTPFSRLDQLTALCITNQKMELTLPKS